MRKKQRLSISIVLAAVLGALFSLPVWREVSRQKEETRRERVRMKDMEVEKAEWLTKQARYENPASREELIRAAGYKKPLEKRVETLSGP